MIVNQLKSYVMMVVVVISVDGDDFDEYVSNNT